MLDAIVVGGGIAGLSAAYELQEQGLSFLLLEKAPRPGGVIVSEEVDGYVIDGGPDSLLVQKPEAIALCREIGLGDRLVPTKPPRLAYIQRGGRLHALPASSVLGIPTRIGPFIGTSLFTWAGKMRMAAELFVPARTDGADESIGSFMRRRFGDEATTYLAEPLLAGIHAGDVDKLSIKALFPRLAETERKHGSLLATFRQARQASGSSDGAFRSLPGGLSELVRALVTRLPPESVRFNAPVRRVLLSPSRVETLKGEHLTARAVVVTTPAFVAADLLRDQDADIGRLCQDVRYASTATIALAFPRSAVSHPLNGSGFVVPRTEGTGILAASWLSSKWPHRAPDDRVLMRAFFGGARDEDAIGRSDAQLQAAALAALRPLLGISGEPLLSRVYRFERASAQHEVGHLERIEKLDRILGRTPGLFMTGSGLRGVGIPDCVADARATARKVAQWLRQ